MKLSDIKPILDSEEMQQRMDSYVASCIRKSAIKEAQIVRLHSRGMFAQLTEKAICKYSSSQYQDRWYGRGFEPPNSLFWFLYDYAKMYGRTCNDEEWEKYSCDFSSEMFFCEGYYLTRLDGQGSVIQIMKA